MYDVLCCSLCCCSRSVVTMMMLKLSGGRADLARDMSGNKATAFAGGG